MVAGSKKNRASKLSEADMLELLRKSLHTKIDDILKVDLTGTELCLGCLNLSGQLLKAGSDLIDAAIGSQLVASRATKFSDPEIAGRHAREEAKELILGVPGATPEGTAAVGLLGASFVVGHLASTSGDPYLHGLAAALLQLRFGQVHPWLKPPRLAVHPPDRAKTALDLKATPFCVIEYLVVSGLYDSKTKARGDVVDRLGVSEDTLNDWKKQQRKFHRADLQHRLEWVAQFARQAKLYRGRLKEVPTLQVLIDAHDDYFGLPALDRVAKALEEIGANKGQKRK